jgi:ribosomal protein S18 acetylase RimI-like enzyme
MNIRKAQKKDTKKIMDLLTQVNMVHHDIRPDLFHGPATKYSEKQLEDMMNIEANPIFVAVDEQDKVLGYAFCQTEQCLGSSLRTNVKTLYLDDLCVDQNCRGQHVGKAIFDEVVCFAREHGYYHLTLHVWEGNDSAEKFYAAQGMTTQFTCLEKILS